MNHIRPYSASRRFLSRPKPNNVDEIRAIPAHPLGIKPLGNVYACQENAKSKAGLFSLLGDELTLQIAELLDADSLLELEKTCKFLRAFANFDEIWKTIFLEEGPYTTFKWNGSWKETHLKRVIPRLQLCSGVFSDVLYRPYLCAKSSLEQYSLNIPKENAIPRMENISENTFHSYWVDKPFILTDVIGNWPVSARWSFESLVKTYGSETFREEAVDWSLSSYFGYMSETSDESPLYLFDHNFVEKMRLNVGNETGTGDYWSPSCFGFDLFKVLGSDRPDHRWLIVGPERSGSTFHKDPNATSAWNAVITGSKYWLTFPPSVTPPGVFVSADGGEVTSPLSIAEYLLSFHKIARKSSGCLEGICAAGEVMHVPSGWWHLVVNLESSIAITQNFVTEHTASKVLNFLDKKRLQVSGFRAHVSNPYLLFSERLQERFPVLHTELMTLSENKKRKWKDIVDGNDAENGCQPSFSFSFHESDDSTAEIP